MGVYTYKHEASFIVLLSDSYLPKIMWYKTFASCMYAKILISMYVGSITLNNLFTYDLCINTKFGQGNPVSNPLVNTCLLNYFWLTSLRLRDTTSSPNANIYFPLFFLSFPYRSFGTERLWYRSPTASFLLFCFSLTYLSWLWGCGIESARPHFIFLFNSLNQPRGRRFYSHTP